MGLENVLNISHEKIIQYRSGTTFDFNRYNCIINEATNKVDLDKPHYHKILNIVWIDRPHYIYDGFAVQTEHGWHYGVPEQYLNYVPENRWYIKQGELWLLLYEKGFYMKRERDYDVKGFSVFSFGKVPSDFNRIMIQIPKDLNVRDMHTTIFKTCWKHSKLNLRKNNGKKKVR